MQLFILSVTQTLDNQTMLKNMFLKKNIPEGLKKGFYIPYYNKYQPRSTYPFWERDTKLTFASFFNAFLKYDICTFSAKELV